MNSNARAVFLDRDGVITVDCGYPNKLSDMELLPGAGEAITKLNKAGFIVIVVSNQSAVARGYCEEEAVLRFHKKMINALNDLGAIIDDIYFCPHHPEGKVDRYKKICHCRKPEPGMLKEASVKHKIDLKNSWMIGDRDSDIAAGKSAGCKTILINNSQTKISVDYCATDLNKAVEFILDSVNHKPA